MSHEMAFKGSKYSGGVQHISESYNTDVLLRFINVSVLKKIKIGPGLHNKPSPKF